MRERSVGMFGVRVAGVALLSLGVVVATTIPAGAQTQPPGAGPAPSTAAPLPAGTVAPAPAGAAQAPATPANEPPPDYVIGPNDLLSVHVREDATMSGDVVVRPDGNISLQIINEVHAAGLTPEQLRLRLVAAASKTLTEPTVTVTVKQINSRIVYVGGEVKKIGAYPLTGRMTVSQMIIVAGGVTEYANKGKVVVIRTENGESKAYKVNLNDIRDGKNLKQNIELKPGDEIQVPD